jgi:hypothetical protein
MKSNKITPPPTTKVRLTESKIKNIISESVKSVLNGYYIGECNINENNTSRCKKKY